MDEHKVFMKCAWRLMPFILLLYFINYIDRVNVGFAALTMNADLGFTPTTFGFGAGVLFWGYLLFQIPGNIIMQKIGARIWMMTILIVWGLISASTAFVRDPITFYIVRFFLGVAEAGFFPGMLLYLTFWFPQAYLGRFVGVFMAGIPLSFIIGGPVSSLILEMDGISGLRGWQWLFIIEGLPATLLAFAVPFMLPNNPTEAKWLTEAEKKVVTSRIVREDRADKHDLLAALHDVRVITLGLALAFVQIGLYGTQLWVPQIVQSLGFSNLVNGFVTAIPFLCGAVAMVLWGHASDVARDRIRYIVMPCLFAAAGLLAAGLTGNYLIVLIGLTCGLVGLLALDGPLFSLPRTFLAGAAAASGIALLNSIGTLGRFIGPYIVGYLREETGGFAAGMIATAISMTLAAGIVLMLGRMIAARRPQVANEAARPAE
jgi:ACS family tartrate transporter-like MFS transporter